MSGSGIVKYLDWSILYQPENFYVAFKYEHKINAFCMNIAAYGLHILFLNSMGSVSSHIFLFYYCPILKQTHLYMISCISFFPNHF